jgi:radical SAM superfamily enzyme with C-terminal helix-hairpin-helix motif
MITAFGMSSSSTVKPRISPLRVIAAGTSWRLFGSRRAAETLLHAMSGDDEQNRMLAGMALVKAGRRSFDLIEERIEVSRASPNVLRLLPDIDAARSRSLLEKIARGEPGELTDTARECIELIERMELLDGENR